jgi:hypothetical protein
LETFRAICSSGLFGHKVRLDSKELKTGLAMKETKRKAWKDWIETARENIRQASRFHSTIQYYEDPVAAIKASLQLHMRENTHMLNDGTSSALGKSTGELSNLFSRYLPGCCINIGR